MGCSRCLPIEGAIVATWGKIGEQRLKCVCVEMRLLVLFSCVVAVGFVFACVLARCPG